jgi:hypothetical protein
MLEASHVTNSGDKKIYNELEKLKKIRKRKKK